MEPRTTTESRLLPLARLFWPTLDELDGEELSYRLADVIGFLYGAPIALIGLVWLVFATDLSLLREHWLLLLLLLGVVMLLRRWPFSVFVEVGPMTYADWHESVETIVSWSAALLFGPTALWVAVLGTVTSLTRRWPQPPSALLFWKRARNFVLNVIQVTAGLVALAFYERWGGVYPPSHLTLSGLAPVIYATLIRFVLYRVFWLPIFAYWIQVLREKRGEYSFRRYIAIVLAMPALVDPFAVLAAGLYTQAGQGMYLFFVVGLILVSLLGNRLSKAALRTRQHARELEKLEQLGRAIIRTPVDPSRLGRVLAEYVPKMFPNFRIEVRLFPGQPIYRRPEGHSTLPARAWDWLRTLDGTRRFLPGETPPWAEEQLVHDALVLTPIFEPDGEEPIGGIVMARQVRGPWSVEGVVNSLPAIQTLAGQIGSALHGAELYRMEQELSLAGQIQSSFLPEELPEIPGWQMTATLVPARQTAGDFYDAIPLPNGRFGLVVADVADKGMGAALYMALARTLLRTYALEYHARPDFAMKVTNRRVLMDTDVTMFVTVFYGVLDPSTGELVYCNAGHNPPYLVRGDGSGEIERLTRTGMALGAMPSMSWEQRIVRMAPGDTLVLYSDGLTDAQNAQGAFFGERRLEQVVRASVGHPAPQMQRTLLQATRGFSDDTTQFDDMTLMVLVRDP